MSLVVLYVNVTLVMKETASNVSTLMSACHQRHVRYIPPVKTLMAVIPATASTVSTKIPRFVSISMTVLQILTRVSHILPVRIFPEVSNAPATLDLNTSTLTVST